MSGNACSVDDLCKAIWSVEREFGLLDLEVAGVKVWQYLRMPIYYHVAERAGVFLAPHVPSGGRFAKVTKIFNYLIGAILHNPFFGKRRSVEQVVIEHPRSVNFSGQDVDIYSHFYIKALQASGISYLSLDRADLGSEHRKAYDPARKYIDIFPVLVKLCGLQGKHRLSAQHKALVRSVSERLSREIGAAIDLEPLLAPAVLKFQVNYRLYKALFKRLKPKRLVVVVGYAYGDAIRAAKDLGIETVEIQHGTFSRYHLGYSYPGVERSLDYFPDTFMAWGSFWADMGVLPLAQERIQFAGFAYFHHLRNQQLQVRKQDKKIIVLSQGALGARIAEFVYSLREVLKDFEIVYKLHPGEFSRWQEYEHLVLLAEMPNVVIAKQANLYELFASARYQIGVFSTAVYEGIGFGCTTLLLDLPGVEYMADLIDNGLAQLIHGPADLQRVLSGERTENMAFDPDAVFGRDPNQ